MADKSELDYKSVVRHLNTLVATKSSTSAATNTNKNNGRTQNHQLVTLSCQPSTSLAAAPCCVDLEHTVQDEADETTKSQIRKGSSDDSRCRSSASTSSSANSQQNRKRRRRFRPNWNATGNCPKCQQGNIIRHYHQKWTQIVLIGVFFWPVLCWLWCNPIPRFKYECETCGLYVYSSTSRSGSTGKSKLCSINFNWP